MKMKSILIVVAAVLIALGLQNYVIAPAKTGAADASARKESAYDRVMRTGTIRCGYINWMPVIAKDTASGKMMGYWPEIMEAIASALAMKIEWTEELSFTTYLQDLNSGRYDLECAAGWPNAIRGKFIYYTKPIVYSPLVPFVRADDTRFDAGIETLDQPGLTAATVDGDTSQDVRRKRFPDMKEYGMPLLSGANEYFLAVITGKADVTFSDYTGALDYMKNNPGKIKPLPYQLRLVPQSIGVPSGDEKLQNMLNTAIDQLQLDGTFEKILGGYGDRLKFLVRPHT